MEKQELLRILEKFANGNINPVEQISFNKWLAAADEIEYMDVLDQYQAILQKHPLVGLPSPEFSEMSDRVWLKLHNKMKFKTSPTSQTRRAWYQMGIAASVTIAMICTGLYAYNYNNSERSFKKENVGSELISRTNTTSTSLTLELSDHSWVTLQPRASITYPVAFSSKKRLVYLKGDAFFSISKNPEKPFYVYNNKLRVKVLGTSFFIKEAEAQVDVRTGKVEVNENTSRKLFVVPGAKHAKGVLLTPNQKAIFDDSHHHINKTLVDRPVPLSVANHQHETNSFNFSEASLKEVFDALSNVYGIAILLEDRETHACTFTGDIDKKGLYEQLDLICQSISGSYSIQGTNILVKVKNCN